MTKKDAYYFSHDANAQDDPKCMALIDEMGMEGYGIYWALIERLRNESNYTLPLCVRNAFAKRWETTAEKIEKVINGYDLFVIENDHFFSKRLKESMILKSEKARESASYRWGNATAMRTDSDRNANGMLIKEKKEKKRKEKGDGNFFVKTANERQKGKEFTQDGKWVIFPNGERQKLGFEQMFLLQQGTLMASNVIEGYIY